MLIFLVGYMGAGKTTAGKRLSKALGMDFVDLDEKLEEETGQTISQLMALGESEMRKQETIVLKKMGNLTNAIIATGGGTPCFNDNMTWMNRHGVTVYLRMSTGSLYRRLLHAKTERPLLQGKSQEELKAFVEKTVAEREKYYLKAKYSVKGEDLDSRSLASWIREQRDAIS